VRFVSALTDGTIEQIGNLSVDTASTHIAVLGHAHVTVLEVIGADAGRQSFVVDERRDGLAEAVGSGAAGLTARRPFPAST
jgi:hypothetical protein